jgi:hypothetical protein
MLAPAVAAATARTEQRMMALSLMQPGLWEVREISNARATPQSICISDPSVLVQLRHGPAACSRFIIQDRDRELTVRYSCAARGFGRTSIKVETPRLAKIDTQGIIGKVPFAYRAEARRVGSCARQAKRAR